MSREITHEDLILHYFYCGWKYKSILAFANKYFKLNWNLRKLKYFFKKSKLARKPKADVCDIESVRSAIKYELSGSGQLMGYRALTQCLRQKYQPIVARETVRLLLKDIDPEGVIARKKRKLKRRVYRNKGPGFVYHMDGYDKLKPFGFAIHACIDGYSRRIMWLNVAPSNNDPSIIAWYYLNCVEQTGLPKYIRADPGTENVTVAALHAMFHRNSPEKFQGAKSFRYGCSTSNQRMEAWWSIFRKSKTQWWMNLFKDMEHVGAFSKGHEMQTFCLRFCFMDLIQEDLDNFRLQWNYHRIRYQRNAECPSGIPEQLFFLPGETNAEKYAVTMPCITELQWAKDSHCSQPTRVGVPHFEERLLAIVQRWCVSRPSTWQEAVRLYFRLTEYLN